MCFFSSGRLPLSPSGRPHRTAKALSALPGCLPGATCHSMLFKTGSQREQQCSYSCLTCTGDSGMMTALNVDLALLILQPEWTGLLGSPATLLAQSENPQMLFRQAGAKWLTPTPYLCNGFKNPIAKLYFYPDNVSSFFQPMGQPAGYLVSCSVLSQSVQLCISANLVIFDNMFLQLHLNWW